MAGLAVAAEQAHLAAWHSRGACTDIAPTEKHQMAPRLFDLSLGS